MNYITSTQLRTKIPELLKTLQMGQSVPLLHRSKIIGEFKPLSEDLPVKIVSTKALEAFITAIKPTKPIPRRDRDKIYRKRLETKYGKSLS